MGVTRLGQKSVRIIVPSRRKDGGVVDRELRAEWVDRARTELQKKPFGGSTPQTEIGSFRHGDGRCTHEEITILDSSCNTAELEAKGARKRLLTFAADMCKALGQESVFVRWGDQCYVVSKRFRYGRVPVVRFADLSPDEQVKHLAMGWSGLSRAERILQVLSLDGWTLPPVGSRRPVAGNPLRLRAVHSGDGDARRAWRWRGTLKTLKAKLHKKALDGPQSGDLFFFDSGGQFIDVAMLTPRGLLGPRSMRVSHGSPTPVTRGVLSMILLRQWPILEEELRRKPLDQRFFPKLKNLRQRVERALAARPAAPPPPRRAKTTRAVTLANDPFRDSVRIVGRMMFLRFLIEKKSLPGGLPRLLDAYGQHGDAFYAEHILPLWFDVLNRPPQDRSAPTRRAFSDEYPFLNGGLFTPGSGERDVRLDSSFFDPNDPDSFLGIYRGFEFTLNEYGGTDEALKIDPSFFGKALESFNTQTTKKKQGVHYTPKPIAIALAAEAILARVAHLTAIPREALTRLLKGEKSVDGSQAKKVQHTLEGLRVLDPAVGSGVLLWACLEVMLALDSACVGVLHGNDGYWRGFPQWGDRSRYFVCNCLYGVDVSEEAVELTKLRLWLALALSNASVSETAQLPNLDLNVFCGDSLNPAALLAPQPLASRVGKQRELVMADYDRASAVNDLIDKLAAHARAGASSPSEQEGLFKQITALRRNLCALGGEADEKPAFNWRLFFPQVFGDEARRGFDVVIANPPYIRIQQYKNKEATLVSAYQKRWPTLASGSADLYFAFIELAVRELAAPDRGQVAFIQPRFNVIDSAQRLRDLLTGHDMTAPTRLRLWVDFDDQQVFKTATNYVAMLFAERLPAPMAPAAFAYALPQPGTWEEKGEVEDYDWIYPEPADLVNGADEPWVMAPRMVRDRTSSMRSRARAILGDIATVNVGLQTSADDVFLFQSQRSLGDGTCELVRKSGDLTETVILEQMLVRECVKGSRPSAYALLYPYRNGGKLIGPRELQRHYPLTWRYLSSKKARLLDRDMGKGKVTAWYQYGRDQGHGVCDQPKAIIPTLQRRSSSGMFFHVDREGKIALTGSGTGGGGALAISPRPETGVTLEELTDILRRPALWDYILVHGSPQKPSKGRRYRGLDAALVRSLPVLD